MEDDLANSFQNMKLWNREDNFSILEAALYVLSNALSQPLNDSLARDLCCVHLDRMAFYCYLVFHSPLDNSSGLPDPCSPESTVLMTDIDILVRSEPPLDFHTLEIIHKLDKRLWALLDDI